MTTATTPGTDSQHSPPPTGGAAAALRLVRSELLKSLTTRAWWIFALVSVTITGVTFLFNMLGTILLLDNPDQILDAEGMSEQDVEAVLAASALPVQAANLYTSGQFFGLMIVLVIGILTVTNEFHHQTATATFLASPHRSAVILAKAVTASLLAAFFWLLSTGFNIPATAMFLQSRGFGTYLSDGAVVNAILLNLAAYVLWAVFGVGFGVLLRSQIGATVTGIVLYLAGFVGGVIIFDQLAAWLDAPWILEWQVVVPSIASQLMVAGTELPGSPPQWVGAVVLLAWSAVAGAIGILAIRRQDIT